MLGKGGFVTFVAYFLSKQKRPLHRRLFALAWSVVSKTELLGARAGHAVLRLLLARVAQIGWRLAGGKIAAPGIDVQAAAPGIARINCELGRFAVMQDVDKNPLHALLVEFVVFAQADQILEQAFLIDRRAYILNLHAAPIGLSRDEAIRFQ